MSSPVDALDSAASRRLDRKLYARTADSLSGKLRSLDRKLYGRVPVLPDVILPEEIWDYWVTWGKNRIRDGKDIIVVIDADRRAGRTRIGKSTLGLLLLSEWDPTFRAGVLRERYTARPKALAAFVEHCLPGQGVLYDEAWWGGRGRTAMDPETQMLGEVMGTLASRQAIVVMCAPSMISLDPEVKELTALRLIVRHRGKAEAHIPTMQFDLERAKMLPFREDPMSPLSWSRLTGPLWREYEVIKREQQDHRIEQKLREQEVYDARRLGQRVSSLNTGATAAEGMGVSGRPAGRPTESAPVDSAARLVTCPGCGRAVRADSLRRHLLRCKAPPAPSPVASGPSDRGQTEGTHEQTGEGPIE